MEHVPDSRNTARRDESLPPQQTELDSASLSQAASRISEARRFMQAFRDAAAREFVQNLMERSYTRATMEHHPRPNSLDYNQIAQHNKRLVRTVFDGIAAITDKPEQLFPFFVHYSRQNPDRSNIWFPEFLEAYQEYRHSSKIKNRYRQLEPFLHGVSYCDVGCGGGDLVYHMQQAHPAFKITAGIDVLDWRTEAIKTKIAFQQLDFSRAGTMSSMEYDTVSCLFVVHHAGSEREEICAFLHGVCSALKKGGVLLIEEDVVVTETGADSVGLLQQLREVTAAQPLYKSFVAHAAQTQMNIIVLIDFLSNALSVGVPEMPFPCGFQSLPDWLDIFDEAGLSLKKVKMRGIVAGNFNPSSHVLFVLAK